MTEYETKTLNLLTEIRDALKGRGAGAPTRSTPSDGSAPTTYRSTTGRLPTRSVRSPPMGSMVQSSWSG